MLGGEQLIEEGFVGVFCDLIYGGGPGWMERSEGTFRESNWAIVSPSPFSLRPILTREKGRIQILALSKRLFQ